MDRISRFRVARFSLFPSQTGAHQARYALVASTIKNGIPNAQVLLDGVLLGVDPHPTTEELLEAFDAAVRQHMLR